MEGCCKRGVEGCPGQVPLAFSGQCKSHKLYTRVKARMEAARGEDKENIWIRTADAMKKAAMTKELNHNARNSECKKECCSTVWTPSQQVAHYQV